jgi:hypothetical protein
MVFSEEPCGHQPKAWVIITQLHGLLDWVIYTCFGFYVTWEGSRGVAEQSWFPPLLSVFLARLNSARGLLEMQNCRPDLGNHKLQFHKTSG